ncbi:20813_t:CDS:2 [Dentiscutata erythropus]|uniref:20813_t:CDS:1 n=1 Tax=Dentiscutata erythropus TaxID=1348616 RepID=A0A9N9BSB0_9GLOM|nr:20813_t:CDS:2 [Dentiscutata erythropus]
MSENLITTSFFFGTTKLYLPKSTCFSPSHDLVEFDRVAPKVRYMKVNDPHPAEYMMPMIGSYSIYFISYAN